MKIMNVFRTLGILAAVSFLTLPVKAAIPPAENLVPSDTLALVTAPDVSKLRVSASKSPQWLLWNDAAMKPFHDKFMGALNEQFVGPLEKELGISFADFSGLAQGQLTVAVSVNGSTGHDDIPPGVLLLLDSRDKSDALKTNLTALQKKWTDSGRVLRTEKLHGVNFSIVTLSSNDIPQTLKKLFPGKPPVQELGKETQPAKPSDLYFGQFESLLIVGNVESVVDAVAAKLTGGSAPTLADDATFSADKTARFRDNPLYYGWFNAKTFFDIVSKIPQEEPNPDAPSPMPQIPWDKILTASGLGGLKSASVAYRESNDGAQVDFFLATPDSSRAGLFKLIATAPKDTSAPAFVPADAVKFLRWRIDGSKTWDTLQKIASDISPGALSSLNSVLDIANASGQMKDPNFDIRQNLINNLGDDLITYEKAAKGSTPQELASGPSLFLFASPNAERAVSAIKIISGLSYSQDGAPAPRQFQGKTIHTVNLRPAPTTGGGTAQPRSLYLAASGGYVALTTDVSMMEEYLRSSEKPPKPLSDTAGLADAAQKVGGTGNGLFTYTNQREVMRSTFALLKSLPTGANTGDPMMNMAFGSKGIRDWFDFTLLPDYDKVSKYFTFSVSSGVTTVDGIEFKAFVPRPPGLNQ